MFSSIIDNQSLAFGDVNFDGTPRTQDDTRQMRSSRYLTCQTGITLRSDSVALRKRDILSASAEIDRQTQERMLADACRT